jgi:hypothetical protein
MEKTLIKVKNRQSYHGVQREMIKENDPGVHATETHTPTKWTRRK